MSHPWRSEPGIVLLAPVTTVEQAAAAAAAGAGLVDAGDDGALVPAIRRAVDGVRVCGEHEDADLVRDAGLAARSGAGLICPGPDAAADAVRRGIAAGRILVEAAPAGIEAAVRAGWPVLADLDGLAGPEALADLDGHADPDGLRRSGRVGWAGAHRGGRRGLRLAGRERAPHSPRGRGPALRRHDRVHPRPPATGLGGTRPGLDR